MPLADYLRRLGPPALLAAVCLRALGDASPPPASLAFSVAFPLAMPRTVLWAWEEPEDLRTADPHSVGVAYLAQTLVLGQHLTILPRHQPLSVAPGAAVMAVVRIETRPGFQDSPANRRETAEALAVVARHPGLRALQVDFDATRSERDFYAAVLALLRPQMPSAMPLSITALVSWCAGDGAWLAHLPIDEAVPMFFRLGGGAQPSADKTWLPIREAKCRGSVGISTDESWPALNANQSRIYLFAPRPWTASQLAAVTGIHSGPRPSALPQSRVPHVRRAVSPDVGLLSKIPPTSHEAP